MFYMLFNSLQALVRSRLNWYSSFWVVAGLLDTCHSTRDPSHASLHTTCAVLFLLWGANYP